MHANYTLFQITSVASAAVHISSFSKKTVNRCARFIFHLTAAVIFFHFSSRASKSGHKNRNNAPPLRILINSHWLSNCIESPVDLRLHGKNSNSMCGKNFAGSF